MRTLYPLLALLVLVACASTLETSNPNDPDRPQNVIFFVADGCGPASYSLARDYLREMNGQELLNIDRFQQGSVITYADSMRITDSASSATAYACGIKTTNGSIAVDSNKQPVETILEMAEEAGYVTGIVSTARITHATPAAFSSHVPIRSMEAQIAEQQIRKGIEVILGGGKQFYLPQQKGGARWDPADIIEQARDEEGYTIIDDRDGLMGLTSDDLPVLGLFTSSHMAYEIDRDPEAEPSIEEMTRQAIELLSGSDKPFFIMIEAGRIDHAGHGNDTAAHLWDIVAFDNAWQAAINFAESHGETLVVATSDHETGGLTLGAEYGGWRGSGYAYDPKKLEPIGGSVEAFMPVLAQKMMAGEASPEWFGNALKTTFNIDVSTIAEPLQDIIAQADTNQAVAGMRLQSLLTGVMADSARVGWSTSGHTAVNVPLFAYGPGSERFVGVMNNYEVGLALRDVMGFD